MFKSYTRKSSAMIGAHRIGLEPHAVMQVDGKWGFYLPRNTTARLPSLGGSGIAAASGQSTGAEAVVVAKTVAETISATTAQMMDKMNGTLLDIKKIIFDDSAREEQAERDRKLEKLETDREDKPASGGKFSKFIDGLKEKASGLGSLLKTLSLPLILGALTAFKTDFVKKVSAWAANLQDTLETIADLPLFKNNILGSGIKALIPIAGAFGLFAAWKPGAAAAVIKGIGKFVNFLSNNSLDKILKPLEATGKFGKALGLLGRIAGKIFIPLTVITTLWETIKGAIDGYKKGGIIEMLKGGLDGLIHGLIGGLIETVSTGIGWIIDQFGGDGSAFKNFNFGKFLDALGSNLGMFYETVIVGIKNATVEYFKSVADIFKTDDSMVSKIFDLIVSPFKFIGEKVMSYFKGKSVKEVLTDLWNLASGNNFQVITDAAKTASQAPASTKLNIIDPSNPESMKITPPSRSGARSISNRVTGQGNDSIEMVASKIRKHEGFKEQAYWDVNSYRAGYGSDTTTLADGTVKKITKGTTVTREDSERDLHRRIGEFQNTIKRQVGEDNWNALNEQTKAALTSVAYNYGSFSKLKGLVAAIKTRDTGKIADAVASLQGHNGGVNRNRRLAEAASIRASSTMEPVTRTSGASLSKTTEVVNDSKSGIGSNAQASVNMTPINASRTNVTNQTQNHLPSLSASTPVEFAPHVV